MTADDESFKAGQTVRVKTLKKQAEVLEILRGRKYRVRVGAFEMTCNEQELAPAEKKPEPRAKDIRPVRLPPSPKISDSLDLHGVTGQEAKLLLSTYISDAVLSGLHEVHIIHGRGSGRVRQVVHDVLSSLSVVKSYKLHDFNDGITRVFL